MERCVDDSGAPSGRHGIARHEHPAVLKPGIRKLALEDRHFELNALFHVYPRLNLIFLEKPWPGFSTTTAPGASVVSLLSASISITPTLGSHPPRLAISSVLM